MRDIYKYEDDYLNNYDFESHLVKYRRKIILDSIPFLPNKSVLEVGCGMEPLFEYIKDYKKYYIVEPSKIFFDNAKEKAKQSENIILHNAFIEDVAYSLPVCDIIIISSLLHEVEDPTPLIEYIKLLCGKDTILHINVPNANSIHNQLGVKMGLIKDIYSKSPLAQKMQRASTFDLNSITGFIQGLGFEVIENGGYFLKTLTNAQLTTLIDSGFMDSNGLDALFELGREQPEQASEIYINVKLKA